MDRQILTLDRLIGLSPPLHRDGAGRAVSYQINEAALRWMAGAVQPGWRTIETGAGMSTLVLAMAGAEHTCVMPDPRVREAIEAFAAGEGLDLSKVRFVVEESESALPRMAAEGGGPLDLVLIDGSHAFPSPFIDWYYLEPRLREGGWLLVDDIQIWTGDVLRAFLRAEPGWRHEGELEANTSLFRKLREGATRRPWSQQPYVAGRGRGLRWKYKARYLLRLLAGFDRAGLGALLRRAARRVGK